MNRIQQILELLRTDPEDQFLNYALALEHAKANELSRAISIIEHLLKKDENYLGAYYQLGQLYGQTGQSLKARETYTKAIEIAIKQKNNKTLRELQAALLNT